MMLYQLTEEIEGAITELKYHGRKDKGLFFGMRAGERFQEKLKDLGIQGIVPVPIHKERRRKRGYNQAEIIGKGLEKQTGIPLYSDVLKRNKKTKALKDCSPAERLQNLFSAMDCGELPEELKRILLVDDIFTTGATMEACSRKLLDAGAEEVYILAIAGRAES
jgi:possible competence protein F